MICSTSSLKRLKSSKGCITSSQKPLYGHSKPIKNWVAQYRVGAALLKDSKDKSRMELKCIESFEEKRNHHLLWKAWLTER